MSEAPHGRGAMPPAVPPEQLRELGIEPDQPLARLTTIRTGGSGDYFARPAGSGHLERLLRWAADRGVEVGVVGSGSNLLIADSGVRGLVLKLDGELTSIELGGIAGDRLLCGGGARLPAVAAAAARAGLSGIEFGVSIPGTVGGAVRMNANAYGGALADVLEWVEVVSPRGTSRREPAELDFAYRRSNLRSDEIVARAEFRLTATDDGVVRATLADLRQRRREAQPAGIKTFGSTFKNPTDPLAGGRTAGQLLEAAGCRGLRVGGACFSAKHANFVENLGDATTADVVALMLEGRDRVRAMCGVSLEPEVQTLGSVELPEEWRAR